MKLLDIPKRRPAGLSPKLCGPVVAASLLASMALAGPAAAAISNPPVAPHEIVSFPERDFVVLDAFDPSTPYTVKVIRNGTVIGTAQGTTDSAGFLEVNHPGGVCWSGSTPNILPEDVIQATPETDAANQDLDPANDNGDATTTANVTVTEPATEVGTDIVIKGVAADAAGNPADIDNIESRVINPALVDTEVGRRDLRAPGGVAGAYTGTFAYDPVDPVTNPRGTNYTATYSGLSPEAREIAVEGQSRMLAFFPGGAVRQGLTIFEFGELGGPGFGGCPATADYAVTEATPAKVNAANAAGGLVLKGLSQNAGAVNVTVTDSAGQTVGPIAATLSTPDAQGRQTWSTQGIDVSTLADGTLTASGTYTVEGQELSGGRLSVQKDVVLPGAPTATPAPGTYLSGQSVTLDAEDGSDIRYTVNGSTPTATSRLYTGQIQVTSSQTIRAIVVDGTGNLSAEASFAYVINAPAFRDAPATPATPAQPQGAGVAAIPAIPASRAAGAARIAGLRSVSVLRLKSAKRSGIAASFSSRRLASAEVRLYSLKGARKLVASKRVGLADGSHSVRLNSSSMRKRLGRGRYLLQVSAGGKVVSKSIRIV